MSSADLWLWLYWLWPILSALGGYAVWFVMAKQEGMTTRAARRDAVKGAAWAVIGLTVARFFP